MPAHAIAELDAAAGSTGKAFTQTLTGLQVVLDRTGLEHRLAFGMRGDFPKRQLIERALRSLPPLPPCARRRTRYAGELRIVEYRWPAPGSQPYLEDAGRGEVPSPSAVPPSLPSGPEQPPLLVLPPLPPVNPIPDDGSIEDRFARFHAANPHIYAALRDMARSLVAAGETRIGVKMLWEVLRYSYKIGAVSLGNDPEPYQLNNSYTSRYARLLNQEPGLVGVIELRRLRS